MNTLTDANYTAAIETITARRDAMIMDWANRPEHYIPNVQAGILERIKGDLRELRRLQSRLEEESGKVMNTLFDEAGVHGLQGGHPAWAKREFGHEG